MVFDTDSRIENLLFRIVMTQNLYPGSVKLGERQTPGSM
jgi:hypothetical protein